MSDEKMIFGDSSEWDEFCKRHALFLDKLPLLQKTTDHVFNRKLTGSGWAGKIIFFLGRLCADEFNEVLLLCANGRGIAAIKLLRGIYERAVSLAYIAKYPDKANQFVDYSHIQRGKWLNHLMELHDMTQVLSEDVIKQIKANYEEAKNRHQETICETCGKKRVRFSWSSLDTKSMAKEAGLDDLYFQCYYEPTLQSHSTFAAITYRIQLSDAQGMTYRSGPQRQEADFALRALHDLMLRILRKEDEYFHMGLEDEIRERETEFQYVWYSGPGESE